MEDPGIKLRSACALFSLQRFYSFLSVHTDMIKFNELKQVIMYLRATDGRGRVKWPISTMAWKRGYGVCQQVQGFFGFKDADLYPLPLDEKAIVEIQNFRHNSRLRNGSVKHFKGGFQDSNSTAGIFFPSFEIWWGIMLHPSQFTSSRTITWKGQDSSLHCSI